MEAIECKFEHFTLEKVKINPKDRIGEVKFTICQLKEGGVKLKKIVISPNYMVTERLYNTLNTLKPYLCKIHGKKEDKYQRVLVTSIEITGKKDDLKFKICGIDKSDTEQNMKLETHVISLNEERYGFEIEIENISKDIEILCFNYIFKEEMGESVIFEDEITEVEFEDED
jgi:hypothetical protein